uniref:PA domain-containing protein n=1 Tax=Bicosoecida sp. CB-2014 TaxID=1486930 RepID=A0A7S1CEE4_9STRA|mmetsp:Transcript_21956/g.76989  ORF Transcript_21956/g.76989 Transcript_21956/m.76989 type:complete len:378 (+) Transcript_21956:120-1253(+)
MASMRVAGKIIVAVVALAVLASAVVAQNEDTSVFRVDLPVTLRAKYPHSEALFGLPSYGGSISGRVIYGTPHLNHTGCNEIQPDPEWPDEPILMIDRGQCDFVRKVRNAELAGAVAVVIADNQGLCGYGTCADVPCDCSVPPVRDCECRMPFMADDGSGGDVNIPSFLLSRYHTDKFKQCILGTAPEGELCHQPTPVVATMEWSLPRRDGQVIFDFWTTAEELAAADFRREIAYLIEPLGTSIRFTPHFFIYDGAKWGCTREFNGNFACGSQCVSSGRYCSPDPDGGFDTGRSGGDVVAENLRQMCIWKQSNETYPLDFGIRWWKYASLFDTQCAEGDVEWGECSSSQQWAAGLDPGVTNGKFTRPVHRQLPPAVLH